MVDADRNLSPNAQLLLKTHQPGVAAYLLEKIGLDPSAESVNSVDAAYAELEQAGLMVKVRATFMPYSGGVPKNPYTLTEKGQAARQGGPPDRQP